MPSQSGFSVLPPPPRYPGVGGYGVGGLGGIVPLVETNNTIEKPTGSEWQFLVGEGTYVLRDDLSLATPPPHPSEAPIVNPNPLATNPQPASSGTKLSLVSLHPKPPPFVYRGAAASSFGGLASLDGSNDIRYSTEGGMSSEDGRATSNSDNHGPQVAVGSAAPAFGYGNMALTTAVTKDVNKRKKPKNNVTKSNSSFISRVIQEYLVKILFTKAHCLCHDVNKATKGASHLDVVMGFSTGEIIWLEPISQRYTRLNKNGVINNTPVAHVNWLPGSENLFLAAHMDGSLIVYDKEKEDAAFTPEDEASSHGGSDAGDATNGTTPGISMVIRKSVHSKNQKMNPVAAWKLSNQRTHAFSFSPDHRHLAVVSEDGTLRIIDYLREELLDLFFSYYGGFSCVTWTPDGKYVLTGGQDDLISIWSMADKALVVRCQGHESWVAALAFDPWRCDDRNYRFGSVGEDGRLCLWDFSAVMLHRPQTNRHRGSISSHVGLPERVSSYNSDEGSGIAHAVEPQARIPMLPPVMTKVIDKHPLCFLEFTEDAIITSCKNGHIRTWNRPGIGAAVEPNSSEAASS
ncbi:catabolite repression protein creC [Beauveria brongniartii RCEF 3172]|uniref:Catabolite repression protein creC n=1 Tax=Beauveria brongniartii RCEF 3172 TaxID=1081107 RepID=A0A167IFU1_9HYPO|nr:catabolite repression protein creC [Beauveria brongniartii RCEF 3172]